MNRTWTRKLTALLLSAATTLSLMMPAALAVEEHEHKYADAWKTDSSKHWHICTVSGCDSISDYGSHTFGDVEVTKEPTCYQKGTGIRTCSECGYKKTEDINATGKHVAGSSWSSDGTQHWHPCTATNGCTQKMSAANHSFKSGEYITTSTQHWQECTVCGGISTKTNHVDADRNSSCDTCGKSVAAGTGAGSSSTTSKGTISYSGSLGQKISFSKSDFVSLYNKEYSGTPKWVTFDTDATLSTTKGTVYYNYNGSGEKAFTSSNLDDYDFYLGSTYNDYGDYDLTKLSYYAPTSASARTVTLNCTVYYSSSKSVPGKVTIKVSEDKSSDLELSLSVGAGKSVKFDKDDFVDLYQEEYSGTPKWVTFETDDTLSTAKGTIYYNYNGSGEKAFTTANIDDYDFYLGSTYDDYGDYDLSKLSFVVPSGAAARTVELDCTIYYSSSKHVDATVTITIGKGSSSSSSSSDGDIEYTVAAGKSVKFDKSDFVDLYQEEYSGTPKWVTFETDDTLSTAKGTIYYNYDGSGEKAFTTANIDDYDFYLGSTYDDYGDYDLSKLSFVAPSGAASRTVELDCTIYYSSSKKVEGTVTITIGKGSSSSSSSTKGDIEYTVALGKTVDLDSDDFIDLYNEDYSGTPKYVTFDTNDTLSKAKGTLYVDYNKKSEKYFTTANLKSYEFAISEKDEDDYDYLLDDLTFVAPSDADSRTVELDCTIYYSSSKKVSGTVVITMGKGGSSSSGKGDINYSVTAGKSVKFDLDDFKELYKQEYTGTPYWVEFETDDTLSTSQGTVYFDYNGKDEKYFTASNIDDERFYLSDSEYGKYDLSKLSFVAPSSAPDHTVTLKCTAYTSSKKYVEGTLVITVGKGGTEKEPDEKSPVTLTYTLEPGKELSFDRSDFNKAYQTKYSETIRWVEFSTKDTLSKSTGLLYVDYEGDDEESFTNKTISGEEFYYSSKTYGDYALSDLSFVASKSFSEKVTLNFTAYYSDKKYVEGTVVINPAGKTDTNAFTAAIRYNTTLGTNVQINANDIARLFKKSFPNTALQYVRLGGVPSNGSLYYNYYSASKYGGAKTLLSSANRSVLSFYFSPTAASQYSLSELTYVPAKNNVVDLIPFTAYSANGSSITGNILINTTKAAVSEVYGVTPKNTAVSFPAAALNSSVQASTGSALASIRLLSLPKSTVGAIYLGTGTTTKADTATRYTYATGTNAIANLRFVPASGFTGSVEVPYVAYDAAGTVIYSGKFSLGIVTSLKKFSDITSSTWCYKYVEELSDAGVIAGYTDGSFKPNNTVTYGAALKLIMLAAGYPEQKPTDANVFSGYLAKARAEGIVTRSNVDLTAPITRLQAAQLATGALKLNTSNLSSIQPFTDTTDAAVRALNAAGVVEGYFSNGTSTYKPNNTLTRGQISAIVWRMQQLDK